MNIPNSPRRFDTLTEARKALPNCNNFNCVSAYNKHDMDERIMFWYPDCDPTSRDWSMLMADVRQLNINGWVTRIDPVNL